MSECSDRIVFLLGAGASSPAGIPMVQEFTEKFVAQRLGTNLNDPLAECYGHIKSLLNRETGQKEDATPNLERLYELLSHINGHESPPPIPLSLPAAFPKKSPHTSLLQWELTKYVHRCCLEGSKGNLKYLQPLANFGKANPYFDVITLNYDACVEAVLGNASVPWTDGFSAGHNTNKPVFSAASYDCKSCVKLVKLHGSVTWYKRSVGNIVKIPFNAHSQEQVAKFFGKAQTMANKVGMVYPTLSKGLTHGPFPKLFSEAQDILAKASLCVVIGYSFGDSHVRRIVIEAMRENENLKLVLVTPKPWAILMDLDSEAEHLGVQERIGCVSGEEDPDRGGFRYGYIENALRDDWLLEQTQEWLKRPQQAFADRVSIDARHRNECRTNDLQTPDGSRKLLFRRDGGVRCMEVVDSDLFVARGARSKKKKREKFIIEKINLNTGTKEQVASDFIAPVAMARDRQNGVLYVVENRYRSTADEQQFPEIENRDGFGRLWAIKPRSKPQPITKLELTIDEYEALISGYKANSLNLKALKSQLHGVLHYPKDIAVEATGRTLLLTQSTAGLWRFSSNAKQNKALLPTPIEIPLCMNLAGVVLEFPGSVLLIDGGVFPDGYGRLMRGDLRSGTVKTLAGGWSKLSSITLLKEQQLVVLSQGHFWPNGRVFALDLNDPTDCVIEWTELNRPHSLVVTNKEVLLVSTDDGVVELSMP